MSVRPDVVVGPRIELPVVLLGIRTGYDPLEVLRLLLDVVELEDVVPLTRRCGARRARPLRTHPTDRVGHVVRPLPDRDGERRRPHPALLADDLDHTR